MYIHGWTVSEKLLQVICETFNTQCNLYSINITVTLKEVGIIIFYLVFTDIVR